MNHAATDCLARWGTWYGPHVSEPVGVPVKVPVKVLVR
jgi:hypothetical protein